MGKKIQLVTSKAHRFGKSVLIEGTEIKVDAKGFAEVDEKVVSQALISGFELVNKDEKFETEEEREQVQKVQEIIDSANAQAAEIIANAKKEAAEIIGKAKAEAEGIEASSNKDEKEDRTKQLTAMKVDELQAMCQDAKLPEEEWKNLKKAELVKYLIDFIFEEPKDEK